MFGEIIQEKFPFRHAPDVSLLMAIETDQKSGDDVELVAKIGQRSEAFDPANDARDVEQSRDLVKHGQFIEIQAEDLVP